ncbi:MAG: hypothetical protein AABX47_06385 [Nanoarchaeota archaeon]|mgnify:CR=1 FL=1
MKEEKFWCNKCKIPIGGHNQYLHDGMCDDCFFEVYFPEEAQVVETDLEQIGRHCRSKPIQKENINFKKFVLESEFDQERFAKITKEIRSKLSCPADGACCSLLNDRLTSDNIDIFLNHAAKCPIVFNVLENAKEEFLEEIFAFENTTL